MKRSIFLLFLLLSSLCFSQKVKKDSIFVLLKKDSNLITKYTSKTSRISGFRILYDRFKTEESRKKRLQYLREHGGGKTGFYFSFSGDKNFIIENNLKNYELNTVESLSKLDIIMGYGQKVFFIEKLGSNKYKFHETHLTYE